MAKDLKQQVEELVCMFNEIKQQIRQKNAYVYERWKAGGFLVDNDIISMYPNIEEAVNVIEDDNDEDSEDSQEEEEGTEFPLSHVEDKTDKRRDGG